MSRAVPLLMVVAVAAPGRAAEPFHFETHIQPVFARHGCNASGCHGKAEGQGGFKLSVFGFDPAADYDAVAKEARGRRVMSEAPDESLLLRKASGRAPHGGGTRLKPDAKDYATLRAWVASGLPVGDPNAPRVASIRVEPAERVMGFRATQPLRVVAAYTDGREADVTDHARFQANHEGLAAASAGGVVTTRDAPGEVAVMAAYLNHVAVFRAVIPRPGAPVTTAAPPRFNVIDDLVDRKLAQLNVAASPVCDDAEFLRRVTLDLTGRLPTPGGSSPTRRRASGPSLSTTCSPGRRSPSTWR